MKFQFYNLLLIIALFMINSFDCDDNDLIIIPNGQYTHGYNELKIKTKKGIISFSTSIGEARDNSYYTDYVFIDDIKNIDLFQIPEDTKDIRYIIYRNTKNNDSMVQMSVTYFFYESSYFGPGKLNHLICDLFYKTKYIKNNAYSIWNKNKTLYKRIFGGMPNNIEQNFTKKYTFENNSKISEIRITQNGSTYWANERLMRFKKYEKNYVEFTEDTESFCFTEEILYDLKRIFLSRFKKYKNYHYDYYVIDTKDYDINTTPLPEIKIKIGNITILINKNNLIQKKKISRRELLYYKIYIYEHPCDHIILGANFLKEFDFYKFDFDSDKIDIYANEEKFIIENNEKKINLNSNNNIFCLILLFTIFMTGIMIYYRHFNKNNNIDNFNYYYDV